MVVTADEYEEISVNDLWTRSMTRSMSRSITERKVIIVNGKADKVAHLYDSVKSTSTDIKFNSFNTDINTLKKVCSYYIENEIPSIDYMNLTFSINDIDYHVDNNTTYLRDCNIDFGNGEVKLIVSINPHENGNSTNDTNDHNDYDKVDINNDVDDDDVDEVVGKKKNNDNFIKLRLEGSKNGETICFATEKTKFSDLLSNILEELNDQPNLDDDNLSNMSLKIENIKLNCSNSDKTLGEFDLNISNNEIGTMKFICSTSTEANIRNKWNQTRSRPHRSDIFFLKHDKKRNSNCSLSLDNCSTIKSDYCHVGLVNQAMTCYLNSLLQTLYMTPEFRNALYNWEYVDDEKNDETKSIPYQLQKLFLNIQTSTKNSVETTELTKSFGWDSADAWQQHDIQELCRVMFDALEQKFKNTEQADLINRLYEGKMIDYVKCLECKTEKVREDTFLDIPLPIKPFGNTVAYSSVEEALDGFVQPETLEDSNQYFCEICNKKCDAHKGLKFTKFPYLLTLHLKRFDFDYTSFHRVKLNDKVTFPHKLNLNSFISSSSSSTATTTATATTTTATTTSLSSLLSPSSSVSSNSNHESPSEIIDDTNTIIKCDDSSTTDSGNADECMQCDNCIPTIETNDMNTFSTTTTITTSTMSTSTSTSTTELSPSSTLLSPSNNGQDDDEGIAISNCPSTSSIHSIENKRNRSNNDCPGPYVYELFSIMIHSGSAGGGHYYAYIKDFRTTEWLCFNDQNVSPITEEDIQKTYGGGLSKTYYSGAYSSSTNAYMLMYRQIDPKRNALPRSVEDFPEHLRIVLKKMKQQEERRKVELKNRITYKMNVFCYHPIDKTRKEEVILASSSNTLSDLTENAYKQFKLNNIIALDQCRLVGYDYFRDIIKSDRIFENPDEINVSELLPKSEDYTTNSKRTLQDMLLEIRDVNEDFKGYLPDITTKVFVVDIKNQKILDGPFNIIALRKITVYEYKEMLSLFYIPDIPIQQMVLVLLEDKKHFNVIDNNNNTLQHEKFSNGCKLFVINNINNDIDIKISYEINKLLMSMVDLFDHIVTVNIELPDTRKHILDELNIPTIFENNCQNDVYKLKNNNEAVNSTAATAMKHFNDDSNTAINDDECNTDNGRINRRKNFTTSKFVCTKDVQLNITNKSPREWDSAANSSHLEGDEELHEQQSNSEDSSLSDSDRTLVGDASEEDDCELGKLDHEFQIQKDNKIFDDDDIDREYDRNNYFYAVKRRPEDPSNNMKVLIHNNLTEKLLKQYLEPYIKISSNYFKIIRPETIDSKSIQMNSNFLDNEKIKIKLGRALRPGEIKIYLHYLTIESNKYINYPYNIKLICEFIVSKDSTVEQTKKDILIELKKHHNIDIPIEKCRLRILKNSKIPSKVMLDNMKIKYYNLESNPKIIIQELQDEETVKNSDQIVVLIKYVSNQNKIVSFDAIQEVVLDQPFMAELKSKVSRISEIPEENLKLTPVDENYGIDQLGSKYRDSAILEDGAIVQYQNTEEPFVGFYPDKMRPSTEDKMCTSTYSPRREKPLKIYVDDK